MANAVKCRRLGCPTPATHYTREKYDAQGVAVAAGVKTHWCKEHAPRGARRLDGKS
jgi:hypothetical protein